ncbi:hypothetical protein, partial [Actinocorallia longicatena]|uniref:hypothetical protein n=1 Tax=Actinocorallia longicatena TaxID=111803 RepID=UPI0031D52C9C
TSTNDHVDKVSANTNPWILQEVFTSETQGFYLDNHIYEYEARVNIYNASWSSYTINAIKYTDNTYSGVTSNSTFINDSISMNETDIHTVFGLNNGYYKFRVTTGSIKVELHKRLKNSSPSINLSTTNYQVLSEVSSNNVLVLNGSDLDSDIGNVINVKYSVDGLSGHQNKVIP